MKNFYRKALAPILLSLLAATMAYAQTNIKGKITDGTSGEGLPGVNIIVKGRVIGTITDTKGQYSLSVNSAPPFTLVFSFVGYATQEFEILDGTTTVDIKMNEQTIMGQEVVVSASRTEESILKSPVTIEKVDLLTIKQTASPDFYDALANVKGVQVNNGSLNFTAVNTRGFATIANTRFVQWVDGMDTQAPLLNFPTGTIMGLGELDAESIELTPGAASALYGPNAFNGIMIMKSKSPFEYQGLSAQLKTGITNSDAGGSHPMNQVSIRYAKAFNNKFAFKVNFSYMKATDWYSNDYKTDKNNTGSKTDLSSSQNFDGLNLYGDETPIPTGVPSLGDNGIIRRTGFKEGDLLDNRDAKTIKGDVALHYRLTDRLEILYNYRYGGGNSIYQGQAKYALRDFNQQFHKLELKGDNFFIRAYSSATDAGKSYNLDALGAYVNEAINPTDPPNTDNHLGWAKEYVLASQGYFTGLGVPAGNPVAARNFADNYVIYTDGTAPKQVDPNALPGIIKSVRKQFFQRTPPGASFYDNSKLYHSEFYYNFNKIKWAEIIVGGSYRIYSLFSNGTIFNEDPAEGKNFKRINTNTGGIYTQISKNIVEKLKLTGSIRYDKMKAFDGHFTPRVSAVYTFNQEHNIRVNFQTGFRLPDTQTQFIYFPGTGIILGGTPSNASRYGIYNGGAWTQESYDQYIKAGGQYDKVNGAPTTDTHYSLLKEAKVKYVKPEQLWSYEFGYKGVIAKKLLADVNYYYTSYTNFIGGQYVASKTSTVHQTKQVDAGTLWLPYTNSPTTLTSYGIGVGLTYNLPKNFVVTGNYNYATFSGTQPPGFQSNFNTPKNKYNIGIGNRKVTKNLGFNVNYRYQESFYWESSYGVGNIPAYGVLDAQISYKVAPMKTVFKVGGTNLGGGDYRTNIGSPFIGQQYYVSVTFDQFLK